MRQLALFSPSLNVTARLKASMREALHASRLSREEVADKMRALAQVDGLGGGRGSTISAANLDAWVAEGKPNLIPVNLLPLFCHVVACSEPLAILAAPLNALVVDRSEQQLLEWARVEVASRKLAKKRRRLLSEMEAQSDE